MDWVGIARVLPGGEVLEVTKMALLGQFRTYRITFLAQARTSPYSAKSLKYVRLQDDDVRIYIYFCTYTTVVYQVVFQLSSNCLLGTTKHQLLRQDGCQHRGDNRVLKYE